MEMKANLISDDSLELVTGGVNYSTGGWTAKVIVGKLKVQDRNGDCIGSENAPLCLHGGDIITVLREHSDGRCQIDLSNVPGGQGKEGYVASHYLQFID